jgi:misacylated tRNA(Ala) deacylase
MITEALYGEDPYRSSCEATVVSISERGGIILDRTVFYAAGGGQPGDSGLLRFVDGSEIAIATTVKGDTPGEIVHVPASLDVVAEPARQVEACIDWERRHRLMRIHTCLHLLSVAVPHPVTGGQISDDYGRLDFDVGNAQLDKDALTDRINEMVAADHQVSAEWITDEELAARPDLVKTMKVKPPMGSGNVRLIRIGDVDLQPCGGTHVRSTAEIGPVRVSRIESKGAHNRRVRVTFAE